MAKSTDKREAAKTSAIEKQSTALSARPSFIPVGDRTGTEHITQNDMVVARLALAQKTSPQVEEGKPEYNPELRFMDMFNTITGKIYGRELDFVIIKADPPRHMELRDLKEGGGIIDGNVPAGDPRTQWGPKGEKPRATKFYDFFVLTLPLDLGNLMENFACISLKSTGIRAAKSLNQKIHARNAPIYAGRYTAISEKGENAKGSYAVFKFRNSEREDEWTARVDGEFRPGWISEGFYKVVEDVNRRITNRVLRVDDTGEGADTATDPDDPMAEKDM